MDDSLLVRRFERLGYLSRDGQGFIDSDGPLRNSIGERRSVHQLHHQRFEAVDVFQPVDVRNVWMIQRGQDLCLASKTGEAFRVSDEGIWEHLQRIVPFERSVMCPPDPTHATLADEGGDFIWADTGARADRHCNGILRHRVCSESRHQGLEGFCILIPLTLSTTRKSVSLVSTVRQDDYAGRDE